MNLLSVEDVLRLERKIGQLETMTSAEFKIVICKQALLGVKRKAVQLFKKYNLDQTKDNNAVLLLIVERDKELLIYGDSGIDERVSPSHWASVRDTILDEFRNREYYAGLSQGLDMISSSLVEHFPASGVKENEVSNEIIIL